MDAEVWMIVASIGLVVATSSLTVATFFLAKSSRKHERLIAIQTRTIVAPDIAIGRVERIDEKEAYVRLKNVGPGPSWVRVTVQWKGATIRRPEDPTVERAIASGDHKRFRFPLPLEVQEVSVSVDYRDMFGNSYNSVLDRKVRPVPTPIC